MSVLIRWIVLCSDNTFSINEVQGKNMDMICRELYRDQHTSPRLTANTRYEILPGDFSCIYHYHYCTSYGIDVSIPAERNIDDWLNKNSRRYKPEIACSVFHYHARAGAT